MADTRHDQLVTSAMEVLATARNQVFESAKLTDVAAVFAELAKAEAMQRQAAAAEKLAVEVGRLANAVQQLR
jgi:hypothetical protein